MPRALFILALCGASTLGAQSVFNGPISFYGPDDLLKTRVKPVLAEVIYDATMQTPWGERSLRNTGKFWRSANGNGREDDAYGRSLIYQRKEGQLVELDHQLRTALVRPLSSEHLTRLAQINPRPFREAPDAARNAPVQRTTGILEGRKTEGFQQRLAGTLDEYTAWRDVSTGILLEVRSLMTGGEVAHRVRLRNIREQEPDSSLFQIPAGYRVTYCNPSTAKPAGPKNAPYPSCVPPSAPLSR